MSKLLDQDLSFAGRGYKFDCECCVPEIDDRDRQSWGHLRFAILLSGDPILIEKLEVQYGERHWDAWGRTEFREFARHNAGRVRGVWPDEAFFAKLSQLREYYSYVDSLSERGNEIRVGRAFEDDGETVKPRCARIYRRSCQR